MKARPEALSSVVELAYAQELTYSKAARVLEIPVGTVMSRLFAARKTLKAFRDGGEAFDDASIEEGET